jgi:hypothetical protein
MKWIDRQYKNKGNHGTQFSSSSHLIALFSTQYSNKYIQIQTRSTSSMHIAQLTHFVYLSVEECFSRVKSTGVLILTAIKGTLSLSLSHFHGSQRPSFTNLLEIGFMHNENEKKWAIPCSRLEFYIFLVINRIRQATNNAIYNRSIREK